MIETKKENKLAIKGRILWIYTKYQLITKLITALLLLPTFSFISSKLIYMSGRTNLTSGDYIGFLFSIYGIPLILLGIILLILILGIDINTFILISALIEEGKLNIKIKDILFASIKSVKIFFSPIGAMIVLFVAFAMPLIGLEIKLGPLKNFQIPNFITSVIFSNKIYTALYVIALILLFIVAIIYSLSIHFALIDGKNIYEALKSSRLFMKKYWKTFIKDYLIKLIKLFIVCTIVAIIFIFIITLIDMIFSPLYSNENVSFTIFLLSILEIITFIGFLAVPFSISHLTELFYEYHKREGKILELKLAPKSEILTNKELTDKIKIKTKVEVIVLLVIIFAFNLGIAHYIEKYFVEIFKINTNIELVAHRAGGDLEAENTINGVKEAIKQRVKWVEIDVQRTKDGQYIINHDATFNRVSGVNKTPMEMTFEEIKKLEVKNEFDENKPSRKVATFEEILDTAKGKIGVFVELKEKSADYKMVDDVVKMIEDKNMLDECVILSLNYDIIKYTHANYPQIKTGFLYFFATGNLKDLKADYLIMEEREATEDKIDEIHEAGKKAVVWTVNTPESIKKFTRSNVDGIITDHILLLKDGLDEVKKRKHFEIIIDSFKY
ncbi:glycerophosphodiester phosphodiesterase family protein [Oceanivirga salmonicida]|uniref:glycerophosphodiester phosphodiesterase family protein n=1 Tax=Oceanivirga salmonicida TaxID=1769291 RepID=UPI00082EFE24|nr:glycerophosphodiester phosphodiesterase family protein [Oceanivirga salmonicida]